MNFHLFLLPLSLVDDCTHFSLLHTHTHTHTHTTHIHTYTHTEFSVIISRGCGIKNILKIILCLFSEIFHNRRLFFIKTEIEKQEMDKFCHLLYSTYRGTLNSTDRLICRIFVVLNQNHLAPPLYCLPFISHSSRCSSWVFNALQRIDLYATLGNFPFHRSVFTLPFEFEHDGEHQLHYKMVKDTISNYYDHDGGEINCNNNDYYDDTSYKFFAGKESKKREETWDSLDMDKTDSRDRGTGTVCDPGFWIPTLFQSLTFEKPSIREIANSGLLSLVLASLGSECTVMRTYAFACLRKILEFCKSSFAERDVLFRCIHFDDSNSPSLISTPCHIYSNLFLIFLERDPSYCSSSALSAILSLPIATIKSGKLLPILYLFMAHPRLCVHS